MDKTVLLAATSVVALFASGALGADSFSGGPNPFPILNGAKILYNQNSNDVGGSINSQNFTSNPFSAFYNDQAADDFVIPKGRTWRIKEVDVTGQYGGSTSANSENVIFYSDNDGVPGDPVKNGSFTHLSGSDGPDFAIQLPGKGLRLKAGYYWLSVIADGEWTSWGWEVNGAQHGYQAMFQNPGGSWDECFSWTPINECGHEYGPDLMFDLKGTSKGK